MANQLQEKQRQLRRAGITMLEVALGVFIVAVLLLATTMTLSANLKSTFNAREMTSGALFLETIMEDVTAQPFDNLLTLNGDVYFDVTEADDSRFAVGMTVFPAGVNLVQVRAVLTDLRTGAEVGRVSTLRSGT